MSGFILYGTPRSTYVRTTRLVLEEKGQSDYQLQDIDIFSGQHQQGEYKSLHPFQKVPVLEHGDFRLFETNAIVRYLNAVLTEGPDLIPQEPKAAAHMQQWMSAVDSYIYPTIIGTFVWQRLVMPMMNKASDEQKIEAVKPEVARQLDLLADVLGDKSFLCGDQLSLLDLYLGPIFGYLTATEEGKQMVNERAHLARWWGELDARPAMTAAKEERPS